MHLKDWVSKNLDLPPRDLEVVMPADMDPAVKRPEHTIKICDLRHFGKPTLYHESLGIYTPPDYKKLWQEHGVLWIKQKPSYRPTAAKSAADLAGEDIEHFNAKKASRLQADSAAYVLLYEIVCVRR